MKVIKIIHKATHPTDEGDWVVWAMCIINGQYKYCALYYDTYEKAKEVKAGQLLDIEKTRFRIRSYG